MNVRFSLVIGFMSVTMFMTIGRWSELKLVLVSQEVYGRRERLAMEKSGDEGCPFVGSLVGLSSFITPKPEFPILSANKLPLVSLSCEYHRASWALKSPNMRASL